MTTVLVTGGAGYIGSHACKQLATAGHIPVVYDNLFRGHRASVKWGPFEQGDILDSGRLAEVMRKHQPAAVMHFAALAYVGESVAEPAQYYRNNVVGSLTLLDAMRAHQIEKLLFSSTCATYGIPDTVPLSEDAPQRPISPYGTSKLMVERIIADHASAYDMKSIALRYFNAAGADPEGEIGENHIPETHLIPSVLEAAAGLRPAVTILGEDYDTPDGTCIRDYVHVTDIAQAHVLALEKLGDGDLRPAYNLGSGRGISVAEIIAVARKVTGRPIATVTGPRRAGDPAILLADSTRAQADLGWRPRHIGIEDIVQTAWRWLQHHHGHAAGG